MQLSIEARAVFEHRPSSSACCGDALQPPEEGAAHEFECASCGQPTTRVLGEPVEVEARG